MSHYTFRAATKRNTICRMMTYTSAALPMASMRRRQQVASRRWGTFPSLQKWRLVIIAMGIIFCQMMSDQHSIYSCSVDAFVMLTSERKGSSQFALHREITVPDADSSRKPFFSRIKRGNGIIGGNRRHIDKSDTALSNNQSNFESSLPRHLFHIYSSTLLALVITLGGIIEPSFATTTTIMNHPLYSTSPTMLVAAESSNIDNKSELEQLRSSLQPPTADRPQIQLPSSLDLKSSNEVSSFAYNPQILSALLQLSSPRNVRPYGTDILVIQVLSTDPTITTTSSSKSPLMLGGAKLPVAAIGNGFPFRISLGPQNAQNIERWKEYTTTSPQDVWLQATICRPPPSSSDDNGENTSEKLVAAITTPKATTFVCPSDNTYQPVLQAAGVAKWIVLPSATSSSSSDINTVVPSTSIDAAAAGIRAPATLVLQGVDQ